MSGREKAIMKASSSRREQICRFFQLPYPLILDILSRLPVRDLLRCRCVCKRLLCFVYDPEFVSLHVSKSPPGILLLTIHPENGSRRLQVAHVDADGEKFQVSKLKFTRKSNIPTRRISGLSSCNGLVCLDGLDDCFYVCNPILGEFITIQPPYKEEFSDSLSVLEETFYKGGFWGLGYSTVTNQYKLLQSYNPEFEWGDLCSRAEIYTIGTGTWRSVGKAPCNELVTLPFNAFLNGILHWSNDYPDADEFIHSFDFDAERFGTVPPPDHFRKDNEQKLGYSMIGVLGGCLFICHIRNEVQYDVWVMKEYGVKESWTKQFVIENLNPMDGIRVGDFFTPMFVLSNGEILMSDANEVVCYNQERKEFRRTDFFWIHPELNGIEAVAYTPYFVSLYDVAKEEKICRMQRTSVYNKICTQEFLDCIGYGARLTNSS